MNNAIKQAETTRCFGMPSASSAHLYGYVSAAHKGATQKRAWDQSADFALEDSRLEMSSEVPV